MQLASADPAQLEAILNHTYPVWGEGLSRHAYGAWNRAQMATAWGRGHLRRLALTDRETLVASAKRYDLDACIGAATEPIVGIGAVFTPPELRGRGHARDLIDRMLTDAATRGCRYALLFSEIGAAYYESMGFRVVPRQTQTIETVRKPGAPATFVRSGEPSDLAVIAEINRRYREGASFALARSPELIEFFFARRRLMAGLGPSGLRTAEFFVSEEGHRPVAYVFITRGPNGVVLEECGDRDPSGARVGSMLQVLASREPAESLPPMMTWLPAGLRPPQVKVTQETPAKEIMMMRPIGDAPPLPMGSTISYWNSDVF